MNQIPKQFVQDITNADQLRCGRTMQGKNQIIFNASTAIVIRKNQISIVHADNAVFALSEPCCLIHCSSLKETSGTVAFSIFKNHPVAKTVYIKL